MEITMAVFSESATIREDGLRDLYGLFRIIETPVVPYRHPVMSLALTFRAGPGEKGALKDVDLHIVDDDGRLVAPVRSSYVMAPTNAYGVEPEVDQVLDIVGLTFPRYGKYHFDILINGDSKRQLELIVCPPSEPCLERGHESEEEKR